MGPALNSGFTSVKWLGYCYSPLDGILVHQRVTPSIFAGTHLYTWVKRSTVRVKCLTQEHNTITPARVQTRTTQSGVKHINHEATVPLQNMRKVGEKRVMTKIYLGSFKIGTLRQLSISNLLLFIFQLFSNGTYHTAHITNQFLQSLVQFPIGLSFPFLSIPTHFRSLSHKPKSWFNWFKTHSLSNLVLLNSTTWLPVFLQDWWW